MTGTKAFLKRALVVAVLLLASGPPGKVRAGAVVSLGLDLGYFFPVGEWTEHRYAPGVSQFGGGITLGLDLEVRPFQWLGISAFGGYTGLDTSDWERFAESQGDQVSGSARMFYAGLMLKPYLWTDRYHALKLQLGLGFFSATGEESFGHLDYDYDFLSGGLGVVGGIEFNRYLNDRFALTVNGMGMHVDSGVEYADGPRHAIIGFRASVGTRLRF